MKLFKPVSEGFNPSSVAGSISHGYKKSLKLSRAKGSTDTVKTTQMKETKPVTVILLSNNVFVVPKDKKKLREEQRMNCCDCSIDDTAIEVKNKIVTAFLILADKDITFLQATNSGDLFKVKAQVTGKSIFNLTTIDI